MNNERKFRIDERVEWLDESGVKHTGYIVEYSYIYDPVTISTKYRYLVKNDKGGYVGLEENQLKSLEN